MTADSTTDATAGGQQQGSRGRKAARKKNGPRGQAAKRGRPASRSSRSSGRRGAQSTGAEGGAGGRLLAAAGRAMPLAGGGFGEPRIVQRLADERPYMLGAIGLGIGAMIGLMLPGTLASLRGRSGRGRGRS